MKLLSVDLARSLWFGHMIDSNPKGIALSPIALYMSNLYRFKKLPPPNTDAAQGAKFEDGEFLFKESEPLISVTLTVYPDGMIADTRSSTECSDAFLTDLFTGLSKQFKLPPYDAIVRQKKYLSQLWVSTTKSFNLINPKLQEIATFLTENVEGPKIPFEFGGISFWPDQTEKISPSAFAIERAVNTPFSENRYFSRAPLQTEKHIQLLSKLEEILS